MPVRRCTALGATAAPVAIMLTGLAAAAPSASTGPAPQTPPNIVFIMADDLGWSDTSNPLTTRGNPSDFYETPTLDRLAREGMAFDQAYASANCAPSRAALLTGQYAPRPTNNIYQVDNLNRGGDNTLLVGPDQGLPGGVDALPAEAVTVAETLRGAGYTTGYVGKFHVTDEAQAVTGEHGFDHNIGGNTYGSPGRYHARDGAFASPQIGPELDAYAADYTQRYVDENIKPYSHGVDSAAIDALVGTDKHVTDAIADATIEIMGEHDDAPFFVVMSPYAVHTPVGPAQARADLLAKYQDKAPGTGPSSPSYGALVEGLDQSVARIVDHLETTADPARPGRTLADNTVLIFYSDNGGMLPSADNGPLRGTKGELHEGGIRVPLIAWSANPALVDAGTVTSTPVYSVDFYPTLAELAGASPPDGVPLDGADLSGLFADATATIDRGHLFWHLPGYLSSSGRDQRPQSVVRSGDWKLVYSYESQDWDLYDLAADIGETTDLSATEPQIVQRLGRVLIAWLARMDAPLATLRAGREPIQLTVTGTSYASGRISTHHDDTIVVRPGEEMPLVLPAAEIRQ